MKNMPKTLILMTFFCIVSGILAAVIFKASKLYYTIDGSNMDEMIVFKYMTVSLLVFIVTMFVIKLRDLGRKQALKYCSLVFLTGLVIVLVFGTIITRVSIHTACDEYGPESATCQDEQDPDQGFLWKVIYKPL